MAVRCNNQLCGHFNILDLAGARWHRQAIFAQAFNVKRDGLADLGLNLFDRCKRSLVC